MIKLTFSDVLEEYSRNHRDFSVRTLRRRLRRLSPKNATGEASRLDRMPASGQGAVVVMALRAFGLTAA